MKKLIFLAFILFGIDSHLHAQTWDSLQVDQKRKDIKNRQTFQNRQSLGTGNVDPVKTDDPNSLNYDPSKRINEDPDQISRIEKITWKSWLMSSLHIQLLPIVVRGTELTYELKTRNLTSYALTGGYYFNGRNTAFSNEGYWEGYRFEGSYKKFNKRIFNSGYRYMTFGAGYKSYRNVEFNYWINQPNVVKTVQFASAAYLHGGTGTRQYLRQNVFLDFSLSLLFVSSINGSQARFIETPIVNRYTTGFAFRMLFAIGIDF